MSSNPLESFRSILETTGNLIKLTGEDPKAQAATENLGESAVIITQAIKNALLPLEVLNHAINKARRYFNNQFIDELKEKASRIPPDQVVEPKASVAIPAMHNLGYSCDEKDLKEMYLNLLATSMDKRFASTAHPSFVDIIRQLSSEDAKLLKAVLGKNDSTRCWGYVRFDHIAGEPNSGDIVVGDYTAPCVNKEPIPNLVAVIQNWERLGLVSSDIASNLSNANKPVICLGLPSSQSSSLPDRPNFQSKQEAVKTIGFSVNRTQLGKQFAIAVGLF